MSFVVNNLTKNSGCITRGFKSDLKIKWIKPAKIPCTHPSKSGDGGLKRIENESILAYNYSQSQELKDAPEIVRKLFSLEFMPMKETEILNKENTRDLVKRYEHDKVSMEAKIAVMTSEVLYLQKYLDKNPRDKKTFVFLKHLIDRRKKFLSKLRKWDYRRFEWILEQLNLTYKPNPVEYYRVTRKDSMRKLTKKHCDELIQEKINAYKAELAEKKKIFLNSKVERLEFIRAEEIACGVEPTVSEEEIQEAKKIAAQYK